MADITDLTVDDGPEEDKEPVVIEVEDGGTVNEPTKRKTNNQREGISKPPPGPPRKKTKKPVKEVKPVGDNSTSEVWDHFTRIGVDRLRCKCNYCPKTYAADPKKHGTSSMWTHLLHSCRNYPHRLEDKRQKTLAFNPGVGKENGMLVGNLTAVVFSQDVSRKDLATMVIIDELPFRMVEGPGFKRFCYGMQPRFNIPSRMTVARDVLKIYEEEKLKLKRMLRNQRVCLTTDTWTSIQNFNYMCITCHWIDDSWKYHKRILTFCQVPNHKGETVGKVLEASLKDWGIGKLFTVTVDNASSNDGAIRYLKRKTREWRGTILGHEFLHVRCCAHILNLIVKDGLEEIEDSIVKIRNVVRYVRSSPSRLNSFKKCVEEENITSKSLLCLDVETRWNSTYMMLGAAKKFEKAFIRLEEDDSKYSSYFNSEENEESGVRKGRGRGNRSLGSPNKDDWKRARFFNQYLEVFYHTTLRLSGSSYVTSNNFFDEIVGIQDTLIEMISSEDNDLKAMAESMKKKFDKYWDNLDNINFLLYMAVVLDPRYKLKYVEFCFGQVHDSAKALEMTKKVEVALLKLFEFYVQRESCGTNSNSPMTEAQSSAETLVPKRTMQGKHLKSKYVKQLEDEECMETKTELAKYLMEACELIDDSFCILSWWKLNEMKYPVVSKIAKDVLAIPISSVASEITFSTGKRVLDPFRSSMSPKMVEALICGQNWLKADMKRIDLRDSMDVVSSYDEIEPGSELNGPSSIVVDE